MVGPAHREASPWGTGYVPDNFTLGLIFGIHRIQYVHTVSPWPKWCHWLSPSSISNQITLAQLLYTFKTTLNGYLESYGDSKLSTFNTEAHHLKSVQNMRMSPCVTIGLTTNQVRMKPSLFALQWRQINLHWICPLLHLLIPQLNIT